MSEWVLLVLGGLNLLLLVWLLLRGGTSPGAQAEQTAALLAAQSASQRAEQTAWQQQQFAAVQSLTERLERELRTGLVWSMAMAVIVVLRLSTKPSTTSMHV